MCQFLGGPDRTPRGKGRIPDARGSWGVLKSRVLAAERSQAFKEQVKMMRKEVRTRTRRRERDLRDRSDGYEYVVILRRQPTKPDERLQQLLGKGTWRRTARHVWTGMTTVHVYLVKDRTAMATFRMAYPDQILRYGPVDEMRNAAKDKLL